MTTDTVIVLHQLGSHGPAYAKRYPAAVARFAPACTAAEFADCTRAEIVNAYDNTILCTGHVLGKAIDLRKGRPDLDGAMLYVSDHGESFGENGIYLQAMPYVLAPSTQTTVPTVAWFSPAFAVATGLDTACLAVRRDEPLSHDNLFRTLLGLADVSTAAYARPLDAFAPCRTAPAAPPRLAALPGGFLRARGAAGEGHIGTIGRRPPCSRRRSGVYRRPRSGTGPETSPCARRCTDC